MLNLYSGGGPCGEEAQVNPGLKELFYITSAIIVLGYLVVLALKAKKRRERKRRIDRVMESVHRCGKILYRDKVYLVKDVCDLSHFEGHSYKVLKDLIVTKPGEEQLYKVSIEDVEPYRGPLQTN